MTQFTVTVTVTVTDNLFKHELQKSPHPSPIELRSAAIKLTLETLLMNYTVIGRLRLRPDSIIVQVFGSLEEHLDSDTEIRFYIPDVYTCDSSSYQFYSYIW